MPSPTPDPWASAPAKHVAAGQSHTCAIIGTGTFCWGRNDKGQLGDGTKDDQLTPVPVTGLDDGASGIAAGRKHTCVVATGGRVKCWGDNGQGQLGDGTKTDSTVPVAAPAITEAVAAVAAGAEHTCALLQTGTVECWGRNDKGQLGDGTKDDRETPGAVQGLGGPAIAIAAGEKHTCAVLSTKALMCWGHNNSGQLGDGTKSDSVSPAPVVGLDNVAMAAAGKGHTCATTTADGVLCWGRNDKGQLGDGTGTDALTPIPVAGPSWSPTADIAAGEKHTCVVDNGGSGFCWGQNDRGQLGNGTNQDSDLPVAVDGLMDGLEIAAGAKHTCAITQSYPVVCWGHNNEGQIGDGTTKDRSSPTPVLLVNKSTLFLHNDPTPPTGDTLSQSHLPVDFVGPSASVLYNYDLDRDAARGIVLARADLGSGPDESADGKFQAWRSRTAGMPFTISGDVTVTLWTAMKGFTPGKEGLINVYLRDYDGLGYTEIAAAPYAALDWQAGSSAWNEITILLSAPTYTVQAGHRLELKVVVDGASDDSLWFAYDTIDYPSRVDMIVSVG